MQLINLLTKSITQFFDLTNQLKSLKFGKRGVKNSVHVVYEQPQSVLTS